MATVQVQQNKKKKTQSEAVPKEFIEDCKVLEPDFEKTKPKVLRIYNKWKEKGKKPKTIGKWLRDQLRQWYSPDGMVKLIPQEAHRKYDKTGLYSKKHDKSTTSKFVKNMNLNTSSTVESQKETEKVGSTRSEPTKTHSTQRPGKFNQGADEYDIDELDQYDIEYLKIIIKWLHQLREDFIKEAFKWQTKFDDMQREKRALIKTLEDHGIKI